MRWRKVTLIGVGLLGGSLGLALRQRRLAGKVAGYVRRPDSVAECLRLGVVDEATCDLAQAAEGADIVVVCTPIARMRELASRLLPHLASGAIVTDVGSVKESVVRELEPLFAGTGTHFIGSHPMAGAEKMGPAAARADLFEGAVCVVTPTAQSDAGALKRVEEFWRSVGARLMTLSPADHDELVCRSSHLPHVVAAELAAYVLQPGRPAEQGRLCANGFRDTTRIASGSPEMWRDISLANRRNLAAVLGDYIGGLRRFQEALETGDAAAIEDFFRQAKERRDAWRGQAGTSPSPE